ncbi:M15 family metallopeptidase [Microbacterium sp. RURRCA19A]|uniref:M15 family metallopeptidase n=1 Tax=Microbacterium sp. RURRCA19A TaxID=1907391 RepID=UPI001115A5FF|nr:M15 family metallopeptidase [Microbacterium sp. RURRCA19A]
MTSFDPELSPRRAARAEAERRATAAVAVVPPTEPSPTRRLRREDTASPRRGPVRWASRPRRVRRRLAALALGLTVVVAGALAVGIATAGGASTPLAAPEAAARVGPPPVPAEGLPVPVLAEAPAPKSPCDDPSFTSVLATGDDTATIAAIGGAAAFRAAVASGIAPCVSLSDPNREWVVVNKKRPFDPADYRPGDIVMPDDVRALKESGLRRTAADALTALVRGAADAGAGEIGYLSAFRSYENQQSTYADRVSVSGVEEADRESARAGFSEHQSGLAVDIVPCDGSCGTLDDVAASSQGAWVRDHAWEYGYITRYDVGRIDVTGYEPEAWHLRYIGPELAKAYHDGGFTTLEEFFGLPAAPTY